MAPEQIVQILKYILLIIVAIMMGLGIAYAIMWAKNKSAENEKTASNSKNKAEGTPTKTTINGYEKQSIFNFMEFDSVDDNMIIQKDGTRFLMIIECQGVNYDLMSGLEKASVEEGFVQFLNTLRNPIQIYIQTRSVNLENSISSYKEKLRKVEDKFNKMKMQYNEMRESGEYTKEQMDRAFFELTKQSNLYEYGRDIINDTERMSLNKNVLNKKYYIVVPYYASELANNDLDKAEIKNLAFSEIYTRAQSLISSIAACGVRGKILRTNDIIELLYMAYNRDEAETFGLERAMQARYDDINSTAPDVLDKKMREIDKYIEEQAMKKAREVTNEVMSEKAQSVKNKEEDIDSLILEMATAILEENEQYVVEEVTEEAVEKVKQEAATKEKKGGRKNGEKVTKSTRGRKPTRAI